MNDLIPMLLVLAGLLIFDVSLVAILYMREPREKGHQGDAGAT